MTHDYDPSWDYEVDRRPRKEIVSIVDALLKQHASLLKALGLKKPMIAYVKLGRWTLARYISGTSTAPVIVLDFRHIANAARRYGVGLWFAMESTLVHEYGHAYYDSTGEHEDFYPQTEEDLVEEFALNYCDTGDVEGSVAILKDTGE